MRAFLYVALVGALGVGAGGSWLAYSAFAEPAMLKACDSVLQERLVAYHRLSYVDKETPLDEVSWEIIAHDYGGDGRPTANEIALVKNGTWHPGLSTFEIGYEAASKGGQLVRYASKCDYLSSIGSAKDASTLSVRVDGQTEAEYLHSVAQAG